MNTHKFLKISIFSLSLILAAALIFPSPALAAGITVKDTVKEGEVVDHNLVLSGPVVKMDGKVEGDLLAIGDKVSINGEVDGNLVVVGNTVAIDGPVSGSAYIGAANLVVGPQASVGRDVSFIGGLFETKDGSAVTRDLNLVSLDANMAGSTGRAVNALIGPIRVGMVIYDFIKSQGWLPQSRGLDPRELSSAPAAQSLLTSGFSLQAVRDLVLISTPRTALQPLAQSSTAGTNPWQVWGVALLRNIGALLIVGLLAVWLLPAQLSWASEQPRIKPWRSFLIGLVILLIGWFVAILALILFLGISFFLFWASLPNLGFLVGALGLLAVGLAMVVFWLSIVYFSKVVVAFLVGRLVFARFIPKYAQSRIASLLTGVILYALLASIPYLGWVAVLLATTFGLGALWLVGTGRGLPASEISIAAQPVEENLGPVQA